MNRLIHVICHVHEPFYYLAKVNGRGASRLIEFFSTLDSVFPGSSTLSEMAPHLSSEDCGFLLDF